MREIGIIVDDVHKACTKSIKGDKRTQTITFHDGTTIDLRCKSTLMTCQSLKPTMEEVLSNEFPIYEIAHKLWNPAEYFDEINLTTSNSQSENIDARIYNLPSFRIEDDTSSRGSICQDQNSTQNFKSLENDNCNITNNEWEDESENKEGVTPNKYCYHNSTSDTSNLFILDNGVDIPVVHSPFLSNMNDNSISSTDSLIEEDHFIEEDRFIEEEFDNDDIDYMEKLFYSHKQNIEKHSYISPEEVKTFYNYPTFEEYQDCNEWSNTMFSTQKRSQVFHISINHNIIGKHEKGKQDQVKFPQQIQ